MGVQYYIEDVRYQNGVLDIKGWIFEGQEYNAVNGAQIVIRSLSGLERRFVLVFFERKDVSESFKLKYSNVGFKFNSVVKSFVSAKVYLEYSINDKRTVVDIIVIQGNETDALLERLEVEYLEVGGCYNINNFEKITVVKDRWSEIADKKVDVIIPIYNGYEYLDRLFTSLFYTKIEMRIIAINDCSPDQRIDVYMNRLRSKKDNIVYIRNATNMGFVKSVNKGLIFAQNDVVLVNTDIEVPQGWLERLMYPIFTNDLIASTTPYTNCGTICSFPEIGKDNIIFDNRSLLFVDILFRNMRPNYTEMPTGVGFCMGMSLKAIKEVGLLDEKNFGKGYGEENDWCQRAIEKGFKNVHVENLFVYHKHGGSFPSEEKIRLLEKNTKKLVEKHPEYMKDTAIYFENDINKVYRKYGLFLCLMQVEAPTNLFFNHSLGGGANDYLLNKKEFLLKSNEKCIEFVYGAYTHNYEIQISYKDYELKIFCATLDEIINKIKLSKIDIIYINELVTYPNVYSMLHAILELRDFCGAKLIMLGHDYFSVCPTINLLQDDGNYCNLQCEVNTECLWKNRYTCDSCYRSIFEWRKEWKSFLAECNSIIVFSNDSKTIMEKAYGKLENIEVIPHVTNKMLEVKRQYKTTPNINIGILGVLSDRKGLKVVKEMLHKICNEELPINIVIVGTCEEDIACEHCIITGRYTREELPRLIYIYDIDIIFISSVWPETFSYTAEEAIKMHMPVASFDLGAHAERIRKYDKGIIIDEISATRAIDKMWKYTQQNIPVTKIRLPVLFIIEYESFSSRYRVEHLREHLAYVGVASAVASLDEVELSKISQYSAVSVYRCSEVEKIMEIAKVTKKEGLKLYYDIDDLIFDYSKIEYLDFMKTEEYKDYERYCAKIRKCMELSDILTASTVTLANEMRKSFPDKKVIVCRNVACLEMQLLSEIAVENNKKEDTDKVVLGYFSGSHTHNKDWLLIEDVIAKVMKNNSNVELLIVGALKTDIKLVGVNHRIKQLPFVDWRLLPKLLRGIDINLMPLENELFCWCKSENKWMEAGLVGIPTVASRNIELENVLDDGKNVIFCGSEEEWYSGINSLVRDHELRRLIGDNAKKEVYATHLVTSDINFSMLVENLVDGLMK